MQLNQITKHTYYTECDSKTDRPVLGYIVGENIAVMVDAGNSAKHIADFNQTLGTQFAQPQYCIITHWHWDHTFGMHALHCETIAYADTRKELRRMKNWLWNEEAMQQRLHTGEEIGFADEHIRMEYPDLQDIKVVEANRYLTEEHVIDCGLITCRCLHLPSAHSEDSLVVHVPEERVLFVGDIYNDDFYHNHYRDLEKTKELYLALQEIDFETAVPGHSKPISKEQLMGFLKTFIK